ncbi:MAG: DbpA RNA binding domain-containing protein [Methylococcales bacterium]|nr:DbpA RNA binding domain-containing protein [Methylococcales bacterium]
MTNHLSKEISLKNQLQQILTKQNLEEERMLIRSLTAELSIDNLTCAAALVFLNQNNQNNENRPVNSSFTIPKSQAQLPITNRALGIKMLRYRLDVGSHHQINVEMIKKVLIEESGVDKNNISNINIQSLYTLLELPDEMPPDIFQHLKSVEINQHKLEIRRVKARNNKKRGNNHLRRTHKRDSTLSSTLSDPIKPT